MARPKNDEACKAIESAACACFLEVGYAATTYDLIAKRSGKGRPLVQHYYPKKNLLARGMFAILVEQAARSTEGLAPAIFSGVESEGASFYIAAQVLFEYLTTQGTTLFVDVLKSRELTAELLDLRPLWPDSRSDSPKGAVEKIDDSSMVVALGGFYELAYHRMSVGETFDVEGSLGQAMMTFLQQLGCSRARAMRVVSESALSAGDLAEICQSITF